VKSNALNRASARDFYADYYDADDYADYDEEYDAYLMYEEAAENLERAEREFELMTQLLDGSKVDTKGTKGTKTNPARNSYFDEYYYEDPAPVDKKPKYSPGAPAPKPAPGAGKPYSARHGYANSFGEPPKGTVPRPAPGGTKPYSPVEKPKKPLYSPVEKPKKPLYSARNGYSNYYGEVPAPAPKPGSTKPYSSRMLGHY